MRLRALPVCENYATVSAAAVERRHRHPESRLRARVRRHPGAAFCRQTTRSHERWRGAVRKASRSGTARDGMSTLASVSGYGLFEYK